MQEPMLDRWNECVNYWRMRSSMQFVGSRSPGGLELCYRFARDFPGAEPFLMEQLDGEDPILAAYAFLAIHLIRPSLAYEDLPPEFPWRWEFIQYDLGCILGFIELGQFVRRVLGRDDPDLEAVRRIGFPLLERYDPTRPGSPWA